MVNGILGHVDKDDSRETVFMEELCSIDIRGDN